MYKLKSLFFVILFTSCSSENKQEQKQLEKERSQEEEQLKKDRFQEEKSSIVEKTGFEKIIGVWQIDSTKQVGKLVVDKPDSFQGFVFKQNGSFAMTQKMGNAVAEREIGNYSLNNDSLLIFSKNGDQLMGYSIVKISDKELSLSGGPNGANSIVFFLSKFHERGKR